MSYPAASSAITSPVQIIKHVFTVLVGCGAQLYKEVEQRTSGTTFLFQSEQNVRLLSLVKMIHGCC